MTLAIAILMKDAADAKTRLRPAMGDDAREKIALLLFENTLAFFARAHARAKLGVVTPSERIAGIAGAAGFEWVQEHGGAGINGAADIAAGWAHGASSLLIVHADIPTLVDAEISALLEQSMLNAVVIAESIDGGTNALLVTPPDAIAFRFGRGSAAAHEAEARNTGVSSVRMMLRFLSRDLDTPDDFADLSGQLDREPV